MHAMGDIGHRRRDGDQNGEFVELRDFETAAKAALRLMGEAEHCQQGRKADGNDDDADGLHDGDSAHIGFQLDGQRHHLRQATGRRRQIGRDRIPAMHRAQVKRADDTDNGAGDDQDADADRIGRHAAQGFRRHHGAERNTDQHQQNPQHRHRNAHRPAAERGAGDHQQRARQVAGRHAEQAEGQPAGGGKDHRFRDVAEAKNAIGERWRGQRRDFRQAAFTEPTGEARRRQGSLVDMARGDQWRVPRATSNSAGPLSNARRRG